ncbi:hypothetical protein [Acidicapsa acidisoli]|uniref:hypothetical protein n=1 Tax=Acidicapsa acidisoli TaxID=1615681 RepID=UPI0021E07C2C|nr:hypothetical protein [Acidicapsa acidisoli]
MQTADWIAAWSFVVAVLSLIAALLSVYFAIRAIRKSDKNSSVATLVTLNEAFREAWQRLISSISSTEQNPASQDNRFADLSELMNLIEIACAIQNEQTLSGVSTELMKTYLDNILDHIVKDSYTRGEIPKMLTDPSTFEHIKKFIQSQRYQSSRIIIPMEWYEL